MKPQYTVIVSLCFFERASELLHKVWCIEGVPDSSAEALMFGVYTDAEFPGALKTAPGTPLLRDD